MKKILLLLCLVAFAGCEKKYDNIIQPKPLNFQVTSINQISSVTYNPADSLVKFYIAFNSVEGVQSVFLDIYSPNYNKLNSAPVTLSPDNSFSGGNYYSAKFPLSKYYSSGNYTVKYFVTLSDGSTRQVAEQSFKYSNGQNNSAPVISNLVMPDTVSFDQQFIFSVSAADSNGLSDISQVYYELYRPDNSPVINSQGISKFPLSDKGDTQASGDVTAGDGIFTNKLTIPTGQQTGNWTFKFHAVDLSGALSNELSKKLTVK